MQIIFIDGFPYKYKHLLKGLNDYNIENTSKVIPYFGYSVNIHNELFMGKRPDDLGFFGDIGVSEPEYESTSSLGMKIFDKFRLSFPLISRVIYKFVINRIMKRNAYFIPLQSISLFEKKGSYLLQDEKEISIQGCSFKVINFDKSLKFGIRDENVFKEAMKNIGQKNGRSHLLCFTELDWVIHKHGLDSKEFHEKIENLNSYINVLTTKFLKNNPSEKIFIVSDHGMSPSDQAVDLKLEKNFGFPSRDSIVYFYDSLYLHVWKCEDEALYNQLVNYVKEKDVAIELTDEMRREGGISSSNFGDTIFLLKEGKAFSPNYFGYGLLKANHGYMSCHELQHGIFVSNLSDYCWPSEEFRTMDIHQKLCESVVE